MVATQAALSGTGAGMILVVPTPLASGKQLATTTRDRKRGNMKTSIVGLACTALLCSGAATAHADAIAVSDGLISTDFVRDVRVDLVSDLFTLNLVGSANTIQMPSAFGFFGGAAVDFSATVNGVFHTAPVPSTGQTVTLQLNLVATPVPVPIGRTFTRQTPFTMTGMVQGADVFGAGTLTVHGESVSRLNVSAVDTAEFAFSPTPEPASLLLFGTGLLGVVMRRFSFK